MEMAGGGGLFSLELRKLSLKLLIELPKWHMASLALFSRESAAIMYSSTAVVVGPVDFELLLLYLLTPPFSIAFSDCVPDSVANSGKISSFLSRQCLPLLAVVVLLVGNFSKRLGWRVRP